MFENLRRGRQARNFTTNVPKILDLKPNRYFRKLTLGAPEKSLFFLKINHYAVRDLDKYFTKQVK